MREIEGVLERVATGKTTADDAEALRKALALEAVKRVSGGRGRRVSLGRIGARGAGLQAAVHAAVAARGYREGYESGEFVRRQFWKALEELGECARCLFDERLPPAEEIADVMIPLLAAAEELGMDLEGAIRRKVWDDVGRGVRPSTGPSTGSGQGSG